MFTITVAEIPIGIDNRYDRIRLLCDDYITQAKPLFTVSISDQELQNELQPGYSPAYAEELAILRKISFQMIHYNAFLMHAAIVSVDGLGIAFLAKSGGGKTTRVRLWKDAFGDRLVIVNGDKPILRFKGDSLYAYGTPWNGKEGMGSNVFTPLNALCFLEKCEDVSLSVLGHEEIMHRVIHQLLLPKEKSQMLQFLSLVDRMIQITPGFLFQCNYKKENPEQILKGFLSSTYPFFTSSL